MPLLSAACVQVPASSVLAGAGPAVAAVQAAASENVAKEVTGSVTEQVAKALTKQVVA